jgi:hypothetical protein
LNFALLSVNPPFWNRENRDNRERLSNQWFALPGLAFLAFPETGKPGRIALSGLLWTISRQAAPGMPENPPRIIPSPAALIAGGLRLVALSETG